MEMISEGQCCYNWYQFKIAASCLDSLDPKTTFQKRALYSRL